LGELNFDTKKRITMGIAGLEADYIYIDLGAGTSMNVLDFFLISNSGILVSTPHMTSITNTYNFLKSLTYRFLQRVFTDNRSFMGKLNRIIKETNPQSEITIPQFLREISKKDSALARKADYFLQALQPKIVLNMADEKEDILTAQSLSELCEDKLQINLESLGLMYYDKGISKAVKDRIPYLQDHDDTVTALGLNRISQKILQSEHYPEMPLDFDYYSNSFELSEIEADSDFELKQEETGDGIYSEQYVQGLMQKIEEQDQLINQLAQTLQQMGIKL
jgi:flagellar biosynthesis protein FlhG